MSKENLKIILQNDMKDAMRSKESLRLTTIRMLLAAIKQYEIDQQTTLDDTGILRIVNKMIKQRQDAANQFQEAARQELADKELAEIKILEAYKPPQLSEETIEKLVKATIQTQNASEPKDMGKVMKALQAKLQGQADMKIVSEKVKALLITK